MASYLDDRQTCRILLNGAWTASQTTEFGPVTNSSTGEAIARVPFCTADEVERVVVAAQDAFPAWAETPPVERARVMFRYVELLNRHADEIVALISREHGKTEAEARGSIMRGLEMVEFAAAAPAMLMGQCIENIAANVDCETQRHALGVCVGITPFNFPAMVPLWMFPLAVVCGNTFVLKPSEKVPLSAMRLVDLLCEAGLPPGVISLVHGTKGCVDGLRMLGVELPEHVLVYEVPQVHGARHSGHEAHVIDEHVDWVNALVGHALTHDVRPNAPKPGNDGVTRYLGIEQVHVLLVKLGAHIRTELLGLALLVPSGPDGDEHGRRDRLRYL